MSDLAAAIARLVEIAKRGGSDGEYGQAVETALNAYDPDDLKDTKAAFRALDAGVAKARGRGQQILYLALGALVEAGAPPELAWPAVERGFVETLEAAWEFANACLARTEMESMLEAVNAAREHVKKKLGRQAEAWDSLQSRCLAAVATLSRSAPLRAALQKSRRDLRNALARLEREVEEAAFVKQAMSVLSDQTMLAIHRAQRRGFRVDVHEVTTNLELIVLLADAIVGDATKGLISGKRPNARAVAALKNPELEPKTAPKVAVPWRLSSWTAVAAGSSLPAGARDDTSISFDGVPLDIPLFEGERVLLLDDPVTVRTLEVEASFTALTPHVRLKERLGAAETDALLARMAKAAGNVAGPRAPEKGAKKSTKKAASKR